MKTFGWLLTLVLLVVPAAARAAEEEPKEGADDAPVSFNGVWKTLSGGTTKYTVILKQVDATVTGTFSPGNGKIFEGVVTGNKLTFQWTQDGGFEGTGEFTMNEDGKSFTGSSTALKPQEFTATWNTYKPPVSSFNGTWETITNSKFPVTIVMAQSGDKVAGIYPANNGTLEGTVTGRALRFKWKSDGGTGTGRLVMGENGDAFFGTYNHGEDFDDPEYTWNGKRPAPPGDKPVVPAPKPTEPAKPSEPEKPKAPPSFTGLWLTKFGDTSWVLVLQQADGRVTGLVNDFKYAYIRDGGVDGKTLRFKAMQRGMVLPTGQQLPDVVIGDAELVMDEGGKSFTGKISGAPATGTFIEPKKE